MLTQLQLDQIAQNRRLALARLERKNEPIKIQPKSASIRNTSPRNAPPGNPSPRTTARVNLRFISDSLCSLDVCNGTLSEDTWQSLHGLIKDASKFPLRHCSTVAQILLKAGVSVDQPPVRVLQRLLRHDRDSQTCLSGDLLQSLDGTRLKLSLLPFQVDALQFAVGGERQGRLLIADDMGLGKTSMLLLCWCWCEISTRTVQALAIAWYYRLQWPLLVLCPSAVRMTWAEQVRHWLPVEESGVLVILDGGKASVERLMKHADSQVVIISYELAVKLAAVLQRRRFSVVIADESHVLKNGTTKRTQAVLPLLQQADRCILLSGTPALSRPSELFNQIIAIDPHMFAGFFEYGLRYCDGKQTPFGWDFTGASHLEELKVVLSTIMIRRVKSDVLTSLPPKTREHVFIDVGEEKKKLKKQQATMRPDDLSRLLSGDQNSTLQLFRDTALMKIPAIKRYLIQLLKDSDEKFLVFAHHKEILDECEFILVRQRVDYIRIDGRTASAKRQEACTRFQNQEGCRVALLSITAAGVGLTLTAARLLIFTELYWQPGMLMQAEDRCHRIGQTKEVIARYLLAKGTVDDMIWPLLLRKLDVLQQAGLSKKELEEAKFPGRDKKKVKRDDQVSITQFLVPDNVKASSLENTESTIQQAYHQPPPTINHTAIEFCNDTKRGPDDLPKMEQAQEQDPLYQSFEEYIGDAQFSEILDAYAGNIDHLLDAVEKSLTSTLSQQPVQDEPQKDDGNNDDSLLAGLDEREIFTDFDDFE